MTAAAQQRLQQALHHARNARNTRNAPMHRQRTNAPMHAMYQCTNAPQALVRDRCMECIGRRRQRRVCMSMCPMHAVYSMHQCTISAPMHQCTNAPQATAAAREACLRGTIAELEQSLVAEREVCSVPLTYHIMARTQPATLCLHCRLQPLCSPLCAQPATPRVAGVAPAVPQAAAQVEGCVVGLLARGISTNGGGGPVKLWHVWPLQQRCGIR